MLLRGRREKRPPLDKGGAPAEQAAAARGVVTKQLRRRHGADDYSLFLHINALGLAALVAALGARNLLSRFAATGTPVASGAYSVS